MKKNDYPHYIDLWLVERILKSDHRQEINNLKDLLNTGLRIKNDNNRHVTSDLEVLRRRMKERANEPLQLEDDKLG